jgi:hypothetical protein
MPSAASCPGYEGVDPARARADLTAAPRGSNIKSDGSSGLLGWDCKGSGTAIAGFAKRTRHQRGCLPMPAFAAKDVSVHYPVFKVFLTDPGTLSPRLVAVTSCSVTMSGWRRVMAAACSGAVRTRALRFQESNFTVLANRLDHEHQAPPETPASPETRRRPGAAIAIAMWCCL